MSTHLTIRLTEPCVFLVGGTEHERARARRRRVARTQPGTPSVSRPGSRPTSRAPSPSPGLLSIQDDAFVLPGPHRGGGARNSSQSRARGGSPAPAPFIGGGASRSASRTRLVTEGTTTGGGTREEAEAADEPPPAMLRGLLTLTLAKPSRIRDISIRLKGTAKTDWPEGIGPRRLDTSEETSLVLSSWTLFIASSLPDERRAASMGPGVRDCGNGDSLDARGRTGARRAASVMPSRDTSVGLSYPSRDSAIHGEDFATEASNPRPNSGVASSGRLPLSRITSSTDLDGMDMSVPPVQPWEPSPAYEAVPSAPNSPSFLPTPIQNGRNSSIDSFDLNSRRSSSLSHSNHSTPNRRFDGAPTHPSPLGSSFPVDPSPLGPSSDPALPPPPPPVEAPAFSPLRPGFEHVNSTGSTSSTSAEVDSSDADTFHSHSNWGGSGREGDTLHEEEEDGQTTEEEDEEEGRGRSGRGRPGRLPAVAATESHPAREDTTVSPPPSSSRGTVPAESIHEQHGTISPTFTANRTHSLAPSSTLHSNPPPSRSASSRPSGRFSLAGLSDALRGKSTSRVRDPLDRVAGRARAESPDTRSDSRQESRGRKTALKVLREALTSGGDISMGDSGDEDEDDTMSNHSGAGKASNGAHAPSKGWKEFRAGTYTYPISIPIPASLPPSIVSEFGTVHYTLKATVHRAGALTPNLTSSTEVNLVSCPGQDDTEESESIVVERFWETQMKYRIALSGKSFPVGGTIPIAIRLDPMAKIKLYRVTVILEQKTSYYASGRKITRHETAKKFPLLRIEMKDPKQPLLPIISDDADAILEHPLAAFFINPTSSDDSTPSLLDPNGPWYLESTLVLPDCSSKLSFSTSHDKSNISISHLLKIMLRVERGDDDFMDSKGKRKLWDVIIESPIHILSCRCSQNTLPAYSFAVPSQSTTLGTRGPFATARRATDPVPPCTYDHSHSGRSSSIHPIASSRGTASSPAPPLVATIEQNLLFARLVAGEEMPSGEVPPTRPHRYENERSARVSRSVMTSNFALPPPPFPVQFSSASPTELPTLAAVEWPAEDAREGDEGLARRRPVQWGLRTEREAYIKALESKLGSLAAAAPPSNSHLDRSSRDSGYGRSVSPNMQSVDIQDAFYEDEMDHLPGEEFGSTLDAETDDAGVPLLFNLAHGEEMEAGSGQSGSQLSSGGETPTNEPEFEQAQFNLVPPTPSRPTESDSDLDDEPTSESIPFPTRRTPSEVNSTVDPSRRISFNSSVRISGGVRSNGRHHPSLSDDLFAPVASTSTLPPPLSPHEESSEPANERTPLVGRHPPNSRATSPSPRSRRASNISLSPYHSGSTPNTSGFPSRSSSPCSSIYAPLTQPKQHCPSPMQIRPPPRKRSSSIGITFNEYLRGREEENEEDVARGYRELVEEQRRKRERTELRRAKRNQAKGDNGAGVVAGAWLTVLGLMSLGFAGLGRSRGAAMDWMGATVAGIRHSAEVDVESARGGDAAAPGREGGGEGTIKRKCSTLSVSVFEDSSEDEDDAAAARLLDPSTTATNGEGSSKLVKTKTTEDVLFGEAPGRYLTWGWWRWQLREAFVWLRARVLLWREACFGARGDEERGQYQTI